MFSRKKLFPIKVVVYIIILFVAVFLLAGTIDYWQGWVFCTLYSIFIFVYLFLFRNKQDLIKERMRPGPGVKWWDKIIVRILVFLGIAVFVVSVLDGGRYHWTYQISIWIYSLNLIAYIINTSLCLYAMCTNDYFSSMVRIQTDRGQKVVMKGLYRIIRHPGYTFASLSLFSLPLVFGSLWGLCLVVISTLLLIWRTHLEDLTLQLELKGYREYSIRTKYRLIPFVW